MAAFPKPTFVGSNVSQSNPKSSIYQPLLRVAVAVAGGIVADRILDVPIAVWLSTAVLFCLIWLVAFRRNQFQLASLVLLACSMVGGAAWHSLHWNWFGQREISSYARLDPAPAMLRGQIITQPRWTAVDQVQQRYSRERDVRSRFVVEVNSIRDSDQYRPVSGMVQLFVNGRVDQLQEGDDIEFCGGLSRIADASNPGEFGFQEFFRGQRSFCWMNVEQPESIHWLKSSRPVAGFMSRLRGRMDQLIWKHVDSEMAPLASAMLLGNRTQLDRLQRDEFMLSGTVHLLAISGLHVGILASLFLLMPRLGFLNRRTSLILTMIFVFAYAWIVEFRPPVLRATILISVFCYCRWIGRRPFSFNSLAFAALVVLAVNPTDLFRTGAQLSFLAVGSMIFARHWLTRNRSEDPIDRLIEKSRSFRERATIHLRQKTWLAFAVSGIIWMVAAPLVACKFHVMAPIALIANPLLLIPVAISLFSGLGIIVFGAFAPPLASAFGWACENALWTIQSVVDFCQSIPGGHWWTSGPMMISVLVFYSVLLISFLRCDGMRFQYFMAAIAFWVFAGWIVPDWNWQRNATKREHMTCTIADVGHGGFVLLELPGGKNMIYDCGCFGSPRKAQQTAVGILWNRRIKHVDTVVISHADSDHFNGLPLLAKQFSIGEVVISDCMKAKSESTEMIERLLNEISDARIPIRTISNGEELPIHSQVDIRVLNPPRKGHGLSDNSDSIVLDLEFNDRRILLTGDVEKKGLDKLLERNSVDYDLVMAPHHGSSHSRPAEFLSWSNPRFVVVSSRRGRNRSLGRFVNEDQATKILHTGYDGAVRLEIRDRRVSLRRWNHEKWKVSFGGL